MAAAMRVPIDADRLYLDDDPDYQVWVRAVIEATAQVQMEAAEAAGA